MNGVVIRTNGGTLNVNAPNDTIHHFGDASVVDIQAIASASYHENGKVLEKLNVSKGHVVVEEKGEVPQVNVVNATGAVKVTANTETIISVDSSSSSQTTVVVNASDVFVDGVSSENISGSSSSDVKVPTDITTEEELRAAANGFAKLGADITILTNDPIAVTGKAVLDLNGHNISFGTNIGDESDLYRVGIDGELIIKGSGKITTNSRMIYVEGSLRIEDGTFVTTVMTNGADLHSMILSAAGSEVVINNGEFYTAKCAVTTFGNLVINGGKFVSIASTKMPTTAVVTAPYSYTIRVEGGAVFNGGSIYGIHGAIAVDGGDAVINNVYAEASAEALDMYKQVQSTVHHLNNKESSYTVEGFNKTTYLSSAYYALYCAGEFGVVTTTVNGGEFVNKGPQVAAHVGNSTIGDGGERLNATVLFNGGKFVSQQNANVIAVDYYVGTIQISGGNYNKNQVKNGHGSPTTIQLSNASVIVAEGCQVVTETDGTWSVVAK